MDHGLITDIAVCIVAAWVMAVICQVGKQPLLIAYLGAGFAIGPHCIKWVTNTGVDPDHRRHRIDLLLFMIGLEMDLKKMLGSGKVISRTALTQIIGCIALGWVFFGLVGRGTGGWRQITSRSPPP
jgi:predicted Kef-type K+ transport protein